MYLYASATSGEGIPVLISFEIFILIKPRTM